VVFDPFASAASSNGGTESGGGSVVASPGRVEPSPTGVVRCGENGALVYDPFGGSPFDGGGDGGGGGVDSWAVFDRATAAAAAAEGDAEEDARRRSWRTEAVLEYCESLGLRTPSPTTTRPSPGPENGGGGSGGGGAGAGGGADGRGGGGGGADDESSAPAGSLPAWWGLIQTANHGAVRAVEMVPSLGGGGGGSVVVAGGGPPAETVQTVRFECGQPLGL
jgi:hypothetical protein